MPLKAAVIYDGESVPFSTSSGWDGNGSTLKQVSTAPFSKANHLRATLKVKNWWAGAAYVPKAWQPVELSGNLSMMVKSSSTHEIQIQFQDADKKVSAPYKLLIDPTYRKYDIPLCAITGADPKKTTAIVFALNINGQSTYTVDIDNIETGGSDPVPQPTPNPSPATGDLKTKSRELVQALTGQPHFITGGTFGPKGPGSKIDAYYRYLVGGWRKWNAPDGEYALMVMREADALGAVPMFTYYKLAYEFEVKNYSFITGEPLHEYLGDMRVLFQKIAQFGKPVIVHIEPDFFGYAQQYAANQKKSAAEIPAKVKYPDLPECSSSPENLVGIMDCVINMARALAPKAKIAFHASHWGDWYDMNDPNAPAQQKSYSVADFLKSMGADRTDFITLETSDRDAGFFEAQGKPGGYWTSVKDAAGHLRWVGFISERLQKPVLWWQMPHGVPSSTPGGTPSHYRDNRVPLFYGMIPDLIRLGGFGMVFGAGAKDQTTSDTDGGQFKRFNDKYQASKVEIK
jgi:hypothetical protein